MQKITIAPFTALKGYSKIFWVTKIKNRGQELSNASFTAKFDNQKGF